MKTVRSYACRLDFCEHETFINATSRGQAKMQFIRNLDGCIPELKFTNVRCRVADQRPQTSAEFIRNAQYRGMPDVRCGDRVKTEGGIGTIVGHNSSANFDVLFDEDSPKYAGMRLNCHPAYVTLLPKD